MRLLIEKMTGMRPVAGAIVAAALLLAAAGCEKAEAPADTRPPGTPTPIERAIAEPGREALNEPPAVPAAEPHEMPGDSRAIDAATPANQPTTRTTPAADHATTTAETLAPNWATPDRPFAFSLQGAMKRPPFMGDSLTTEAIEQHAGEPGVVEIAWRTDSEKNTFGFFILRGEIADGPLRRINANMAVSGAGDSSSPRNYAYYDLDVKLGETYYYSLEEVTLNGEVNRMIDEPVPITVKARRIGGENGGT